MIRCSGWDRKTTFTVEFRFVRYEERVVENKEGNSWRLTVGDFASRRADLLATAVFGLQLAGKNSAATRYSAPLTGKRNAIDSTMSRFITSRRKITARQEPARSLKLHFPESVAVFFPMVAGYFGGQLEESVANYSIRDLYDGRFSSSRVSDVFVRRDHPSQTLYSRAFYSFF